MKGFVIRVACFALLALVVTGLASLRFYESEEDSYVRGGLILKHHRLDSLKGKRIIFTGGSNLAFGLDSKAVQDTFHIPVTNLGLHLGLGLDFTLNELKAVMREGDIIFLSPEYYANDGRYGLKKVAARVYPPAAGYFKTDVYDDIIDFLDSKQEQIKFNKEFGIRDIKQRLTGKTETSVYADDAFNSYGDVIAHLNREAPADLKDKGTLNYKYWDGIAKINALAKYAAAKKVRLHFLFPTFERASYEANKGTLEKYQADILRDLHVPVLNTVQDFVYDTNEFYDTVYHLRKGAREKRTQRMIEIIKEKRVIN